MNEANSNVHNDAMNLAWKIISSTSMSVFLTGKAGTGKTTFLRRLRELSPKRMVVLAPTGVAAINAQGQTIHSFFQLPFGPLPPDGNNSQRSHYKMSKEKKNIIRTLDLLVIDEVSMVRCDLLDAVDAELRKYRDHSRPFGGVQLLLIGDLQQLAPVARDTEWHLLSPFYATPYFFGSRALQQIQYVTIELTHIYRQQDERFINLLAKIRDNKIDDEAVQMLNARYVPHFEPDGESDWVRLATHNRMVDEYNEGKLKALPGRDLHFRATVSGNFPEANYPADYDLVLRVGAQVMFIKNDPSPVHEYYNGKIGTVNAVGDEGISVWCKEDGSNILVTPVTWENTKYVIDENTREIRQDIDGTFRQYPLRLAWAITVHKSQGLTFDHAVVDINDSFAHGQVYVALSRCRTLEGMVLARPLALRSVITDMSVNAYIDKELTESKGVEHRLSEMQYEYFLSLLADMFSFAPLTGDLAYLTRVVDEHLFRSYPDYLTLLKTTRSRMEAEIVAVAAKFAVQYQQIMSSTANFANDEHLQSRLHAASEYFFNKLKELFAPVVAQIALDINNKQVKKQYTNAVEAFMLSYTIKLGIFSRMISLPFSVKNYLAARAKASLDEVVIDKTGKLALKKHIDNDDVDEQEKKPKREKKEKREKKPKIDTKNESLTMFRRGMTIEQIAQERSLTTGTIAGHLAHYVGEGTLSLDAIVPVERQRIISGVARAMPADRTVTDVKNALPDDFTYAEIRLVLGSNKRKE